MLHLYAGLIVFKENMFINTMKGLAIEFFSSQVSPKLRGSGFPQRLILQALKEPGDQTS